MATTAGELSRRAGVSTAAMMRRIHNGKISAERQADGSYRIDQVEVERVLREYGRMPEPAMPPAYFGHAFWQLGDGW